MYQPILQRISAETGEKFSLHEKDRNSYIYESGDITITVPIIGTTITLKTIDKKYSFDFKCVNCVEQIIEEIKNDTTPTSDSRAH